MSQSSIPIARHLLRAKDLADARHSEPLSAADLARAACLSRSHFSHAFHHAFGESPHAYLLTRHLERAASLLRTTEHSVADICAQSPFRSRCFRCLKKHGSCRKRKGWLLARSGRNGTCAFAFRTRSADRWNRVTIGPNGKPSARRPVFVTRVCTTRGIRRQLCCWNRESISESSKRSWGIRRSP
jgi:AraC-like DNA-binding protein